ncbi:hypothetical protein I5S86_11275 [Priestia aryabhattai]|nr:hypothetical protein I5S86_11275 [Priestia aryabhattai]
MVFLLCSTFYRLASGALLVSLTWNILNQESISYFPLALAILCSFIPAFVTPTLIRRLTRKFNGRQMSARFLLGLAILTLVAGACRYDTSALLVTNLFVWLLFLLLEASLDMWFTQVQRGLAPAQVQRLSGATTASSQAALMIGPLLAAGLTPLLGNLGFSMILTAIFLVVAAICHSAGQPPITSNDTGSDTKAQELPLALFIPMLLVWPTLGAFNFMLPVNVMVQGWSLLELGILDASFGLGMALIGVLVIAGVSGSRLLAFLSGLLTLSAAAASAWLLLPQDLLFRCACLGLLGMAFGGARIQIRAAIAQRLDEAAVGRSVSRANALGTPVLLVVLLIQLGAIATAWALPFLMVMLSIALLMRLALQRSQPHSAAPDATPYS